MDDGYTELQSEYAALAGTYDEYWKAYTEQSIRRVVDAVGQVPDASILDVGCGTGVLLEQLRSLSPNISMAGVDLSAEMLDVARKRLGTDAMLTQGGAEDLPCADFAFTHVVSSSVLHFVQRPADAVAEAHRVLQENGRIVVADWCADSLIGRLRDARLRLTSRSHCRTLRTSELTAMLHSAGFHAVRIERFSIGWRWPMMIASAMKRSSHGH